MICDLFSTSGSVLSLVFTLTHCVIHSSSSMSVSESFASSSHRLMPSLRQDSRWKPIGQQHNLIFTPCFALTIYGWKWACGGRIWRQIHVRTFPGGLWFIKQTLRSGVREHGFINRNLLWRTPFPAFGRTYSFSRNPTHSFINETPDPYFNTTDEKKLCSHISWVDIYKCAI